MTDQLDLRCPRLEELEALSELVLRSKAWWGYDAAFMAACREELTLTAEDLRNDPLMIAIQGEEYAGVAQLSFESPDCHLEKLFVDPGHMGRGIGIRLYDWALTTARANDATSLLIDADPGAAPFYQRMGARLAGTVPSGSIVGRRLPRLVHAL